MKKDAILDLVLLLIVFWTSWYFKSYFPLPVQGPFVVVSTCLIAIFNPHLANTLFVQQIQYFEIIGR